MSFYLQQDIVLVAYPFTDASSTKKRPALIISNDKINRDVSTFDFIALAITSKLRCGNYAVQVKLDDLKGGRLPFLSEIRCDKFTSIQKDKIIKRLGTLKDNSFAAVKSKIVKVLNLA